MQINVITYNMGMGANREGKPLPSKDAAFKLFVQGFSDLVGTRDVPWFLSVQEIDRDNDGQNQVEELQQKLKENTGLDWRKHSAGESSVAIFSTRPLTKVQRYDLGDDRPGLAVKAEVADNQYLWVVNTHLLREGKDPSGDLRTAEVIELLQHIVTFDPTVPVVLTGDLNVSDPTLGTHSDEVDADPELFTRTVGRFERLAFTRGAGFTPTAADITFHAWSNTSKEDEVWKIIDYIYVNESGKCTAHAPKTKNFKYTDSVTGDILYASDHKGVLMQIDYPTS